VLGAGTPLSDRRLPVPAGPLDFSGELNPAENLLLQAESVDPDAAGPLAFTEVDLRDGTRRPLDGALGSTYYPNLPQQSRDGRWLYWVDADGKHVDAFDRTTGRAYRVKGDFRTITQLAVL
jgi:hypothetical protein